ncbi:MAG: phosphoribosylformylglycinamidine synthase subunit PurL [Deltaproteobacteria bacterium]|nr:phosphoribosylformylglycinamidine synthase subunit PurL [Deltaproteobacteria bacterium]
MKITDDTIEEHGLTRQEYERIVDGLGGREPNITELGVFSVMWSEHCSYKSSRIHLKKLPSEGDCVIEGPGENAGVIDIGDGLAVAFKMESHNHPSFIEPFQGAATGVGGILRDVFTMGARPVALLNSLRFGAPENAKTAYLLEGAVAGIAGYGNCMGIPTVGGEVAFHESYNGNCLVNAMTVGVLKADKIFKGNASGIGNPVMYVGSRTGRDGIHGATMASDVFGEGGEERRPTVQVGDPFTEKLLLEACLEVFKTDHVVGVQDMGAAGLTSSSIEMASRAGTGIDIDVKDVPRREEGMTPYEILLSESQERMLFVLKIGSEAAVREIFKKWDLEAVVIGEVTGTGRVIIREGEEVVADMPVDTLTDAAPVYNRPIKRPDSQDELNRLDMDSISLPTDYNETLLSLLASLNIASKEWVYEQYDHMVRTDTLVMPGSDAAVVRIKGTTKALAMSVDCNSRYCYLDPFTGAAIAVAEAARNVSVSGAKPLAITDCLNFGNPERPEVMWQFEQAILGIREASLKLGVPVISGNVSLYNETSGTAIYPTPTIGAVGLIEDSLKVTTQYFKDAGDVIVLLGENLEELGGSEYLKVTRGLDKGMCPVLDLDKELALQEACREAILSGIIKSAHDISIGGLAVAIAKSALNPKGAIGAEVNVADSNTKEGIRNDALLFGETQSRVILTLKESDLEALSVIAKANGVPFKAIGHVGGDRLKINGLIDIPLGEVSLKWKSMIKNFVA